MNTYKRQNRYILIHAALFIYYFFTTLLFIVFSTRVNIYHKNFEIVTNSASYCRIYFRRLFRKFLKIKDINKSTLKCIYFFFFFFLIVK
jgi:hypothetical protein